MSSRRIIIASHRLPLRCTEDSSSPFKFSFSLDPDAVHLQLTSSLPTPVIFVGVLPLQPPPSDKQQELIDYLFAEFNCLPVFVPSNLYRDFYHRFCKHYLWPLLHSFLPVLLSFAGSHGLGSAPFDDGLYRSYLSVNQMFAKQIMEVINVEEDYVWVHDYHLITLSTFLRRKLPCVKMGFFLHSPYPTSEIFRTIPAREEILCGFLNFDMVGFQTFDYARHFLSSCLRILGLRYQRKEGYISLDYHGRNIIVKILPVGIDMDQLRSVLPSPETTSKISELRQMYQDRILIVGVDDVDLFKGVRTKFRAMEKILSNYPELQGQLVLVQITNPVRSEGKDVQEVRGETHAIRDRVNAEFGKHGFEPIVVIEDRPVSSHEMAAYYAVAECCVMNAVFDGMNRVPFTYTACRELSPAFDGDFVKKSVIVVSEFAGCSPSLSGAIRVNPWDVDSVSQGIVSAISMDDMDMQIRHKKHYKYINSHDVAYWARSFNQDLQKACEGHSLMKNYYRIGFGMTCRLVALGPGFENLPFDKVVASYTKTRNRLILLDYDGTMLPQGVTDKRPTEEVIEVVNKLSADPLNVVFVVSGRGKDELAQWFEPCEKIGIAAEHGYYTRWDKDSPWEISASLPSDWMSTVMPAMEVYTETTDGSYIEPKDSALVWHYEDADPDFGSWQAKELLEQLETLLVNEPTVVKNGHKIVEVNPQGISKGVVVKTLIEKLESQGKHPDFVLCIGDDGSDEDMFEAVRNYENSPTIPETAEVFACTVGNKPSMAKYYLDDTDEVLMMLKALVKDRLDSSGEVAGSSDLQLPYTDGNCPIL